MTTKEYTQNRLCSLELSLLNCQPDLINSEVHIREYTDQLLDLLKTKPHGACIVVYHGSDEADRGFSMFQVTESFSISAHFIDAQQTGYIHVFTEQEADVEMLGAFSKDFFEAQDVKIHEMMHPG